MHFSVLRKCYELTTIGLPYVRISLTCPEFQSDNVRQGEMPKSAEMSGILAFSHDKWPAKSGPFV